MHRFVYQVIGGIILSITSFFCAGQVLPSGGPADKTPPTILSFYPTFRALHYRDNKILLSFNKYVDKRSLEESIFISPSLGDLTFEWDGEDVEIHFADSLRTHTTYIVTIGTDVVDTRSPANRMAKAFALPFSTGEKIDSASIAGKVYDDKPEGVMVFAYRTNGSNPDTLNPTHTKPDYLTQTGKDGSFILPYLAFGNYRLITVRDEFKNLLYDRETDNFGVSVADLELNDSTPSISGIQFLMTKEDTTPPFLSSARPVDRTHVLLRFSESMDTSGPALQHIAVVDTANNESLPIFDFSFTGSSGLDAQLVTSPLDSAKGYRITLKGFRDHHGNGMPADAGKGVFPGTGKPDTSKPVIQASIIGDTRNVQITDTLQILFTEAVRQSTFEHGFHFLDSAGNNVDGMFAWRNSAAVSFIPSKVLLWRASYRVKIILDSLEDFSGNHVKDSVWTLALQTADEKNFGSVKGIVLDDFQHAPGKIYINMMDIARKNSKPMLEILDRPGPFEFHRVAEGKYSMFAFCDRDSNGVYSFGSVQPFTYSERFVVYPDTIKVRARWTVEGVTVRFKRY